MKLTYKKTLHYYILRFGHDSANFTIEQQGILTVSIKVFLQLC